MSNFFLMCVHMPGHAWVFMHLGAYMFRGQKIAPEARDSSTTSISFQAEFLDGIGLLIRMV